MTTRLRTAALLAMTGLLVLAGLAVAKSSTVGVGVAEVKGHKDPVAVNSRGVTVYELAPESAHHLVCTSPACLTVWPPVKVSGKPTKAAGVAGRLGTIRRKGFTQVTLNGHPLYTFSEDNGRRGKAEGEGINNFGGVWHVFREKK
jgi:predicted lipoprotein with Yx(FWY)xxD motif